MSQIELPKQGTFINMCKKMYEYYVKEICWPAQIKLTEDNLKDKLPQNRGVYIIYHEKKPIYVGRSNNIRGRFINQHLCKRDIVASSSFRKALLLKKKKIRNYKEARLWILHNCSFKFLEVPTYDDQLLLEALLIKLWRTKKYDLYNDQKDKDLDIEP